MKTINIYNQSEAVAVIDIDGVIGYDWWKDEPDKNTKERMKKELKEIAEIKATTIIVNINSYGGDVNHGISIHDLLAESQAHVITKINGMTASAATLIALAGDEREMSDNALALVHLSSTWAWGNVNDFKESMQTMEAVNERIANMYAKVGGKEVQVYIDLMNENNGNGKWIDANEMKEIGLVTKVFEPTQLAANFDFAKHRLPVPPVNILKPISNNKSTFKMNFEKLENKIDELKNAVSKFFTSNGENNEPENPISQEDIENQLNELVEGVQKAQDKNKELKDEVSEKDTKINNLEAKIVELQGKLDKANGKPTNVKDKQDPDPINNPSLTPEQEAERQAQEAYKEAMGN